jgi:hypothetical protein
VSVNENQAKRANVLTNRRCRPNCDSAVAAQEQRSVARAQRIRHTGTDGGDRNSQLVHGDYPSRRVTCRIVDTHRHVPRVASSERLHNTRIA